MNHRVLNKILSDNTSGSTDLVLKINKFFMKNSDDFELIKNSIQKINSQMGSFEIVMEHTKKLSDFIKYANHKELKKYLQLFEERTSNMFIKIYQNLKPFVKKRKCIFTLSNSKTVFEVLNLWYGENKNIKVVISESRPSLEGRVLAKKLLTIGVKVKLITDANSAECISNCDVVLIGADKILANGNVVNKTGSLSSSIAAAYYNKPLFVLSSENKFSKQTAYKKKVYNPNEIWNYKHPNLKIDNNYFEVIPKKLITKIITEKAVY